MAVLGKLKVWLDAYSLFIGKIGGSLFGWIHFAWISISAEEHHVLVLAAVFFAAVFRAQYYHERSKNIDIDVAIASSLQTVLCWLPYPLAPALFLPGYLGLVGSIVGLLFATVRQMAKSSQRNLFLVPLLTGSHQGMEVGTMPYQWPKDADFAAMGTRRP